MQLNLNPLGCLALFTPTTQLVASSLSQGYLVLCSLRSRSVRSVLSFLSGLSLRSFRSDSLGSPKSLIVPASRSLSYLSLSSQAQARSGLRGCQAMVKVGLSQGTSAIFSPGVKQCTLGYQAETSCSFHSQEIADIESKYLKINRNLSIFKPKKE